MSVAEEAARAVEATAAKARAARGAEEARRLFELGARADPTHGPLYNAYGAMEARLRQPEAAR